MRPLFDDYDDLDLDGDPIEAGVTCRRCGKEALAWDDTGGERYMLIESNGDRHDCLLTEAADGFERIP